MVVDSNLGRKYFKLVKDLLKNLFLRLRVSAICLFLQPIVQKKTLVLIGSFEIIDNFFPLNVFFVVIVYDFLYR